MLSKSLVSAPKAYIRQPFPLKKVASSTSGQPAFGSLDPHSVMPILQHGLNELSDPLTLWNNTLGMLTSPSHWISMVLMMPVIHRVGEALRTFERNRFGPIKDDDVNS